MISVSFILLAAAILRCHQAKPVTVDDEFERKYEIHEDSNSVPEQAFPYEHSSVLNVRSAQSPQQFNTYPYQYSQQFSPYSQYSSQPLQLHGQPSQIAAAQHGNHQYLAALQQYYAAARRPQGFSSAPPAYSQVPLTQQAAHLSSPQAGYQHPLGALYSAASDVSQFQFSGNGVNYGF